VTNTGLSSQSIATSSYLTGAEADARTPRKM
jgi:hypothetical protein